MRASNIIWARRLPVSEGVWARRLGWISKVLVASRLVLASEVLHARKIIPAREEAWARRLVWASKVWVASR